MGDGNFAGKIDLLSFISIFFSIAVVIKEPETAITSDFTVPV